jgi:hypothetical protein
MDFFHQTSILVVCVSFGFKSVWNRIPPVAQDKTTYWPVITHSCISHSKMKAPTISSSPVVTATSATSIGRGELERQKDHNNSMGLNLERFSVKWLSYKNDSTITNETSVMDHDSSVEGDDDNDANDDNVVMIDLTTDNAYHSREEHQGCKQIVQALTEEEVQSMPDWAMPLRHYRAEKVRKVIVS